MMAQTNTGLMAKDAVYCQQFDLWEQVRAAIKGKYAVIDIVTCLPGPQYRKYATYDGMTTEQHQQAQQCNVQNQARVESYWARGRFFNATGRTAESLDGMIWSKNPEIELPSSIEHLEDSADGTGCGLREVAQEVTDELVSVGRYGILVDMPSTETRLTRAQQESGDFSPRFIQYKAEQIIFFKYSGTHKGLDEVRLLETKSVRKGDFDWEDKVFIRRLVIIDGVYVNQLWNDKNELEEEHVPIVNGSPSNEILFQFFGADNNGPEYSKVTLYDLANMNLGHFVLDCDNRDNLHFHGQGMTVVSSNMSKEDFDIMNPNGLDVGARGSNFLGQGDKVELVQLDATGAIPSEMERDEKRMIYIGAQLVQDTSSNQTLGAKEMEFGASTSTLKRIVRNASSGLEQCLTWAAAFMGDSSEVKYQLNSDFVTDSMDSQTLALHFQTVQSGLMPKTEYWEVARKAGLTEKTNEELESETVEADLVVEGESEEVATLKAEIDALKEQLANA